MSDRSAYHVRGRAKEGTGVDFRTDWLDSVFIVAILYFPCNPESY